MKLFIIVHVFTYTFKSHHIYIKVGNGLIIQMKETDAEEHHSSK